MKFLRIMLQIAIIFIIYYIGVALRDLLHLPIPGSILGLILLFVGLTLNIIPVRWIQEGAGFILAYLPLFFIPATVGVINYPSLLSWSGALIVLVVVLSSLITMAAAGTVSQLFQIKRKGEGEWNKKSMSS
ncbi:CidA/LrgA family protein [Halobacillus seohaensis]|uniref:CidA/LrgA family protein n=1 Tax=Halobacillus seohaensis TaxID=447421 RepID=A0ABW2EN60_9BACI